MKNDEDWREKSGRLNGQKNRSAAAVAARCAIPTAPLWMDAIHFANVSPKPLPFMFRSGGFAADEAVKNPLDFPGRHPDTAIAYFDNCRMSAALPKASMVPPRRKFDGVIND